MRKYLLAILIFYVPVLINGQSRPLVLTHANVVEVVNGNLVKDMTVLIEDDRITAIEKQITIPQNAEIINANGKYLIPGLWDMHVHLSYYGEQALPMLVANGITGVRDMGGNLEQLDRWRDEIAQGERLGPLIKRAGPFIDGPKKMSTLRASFTIVLTDSAEIVPIIDSLVKKKVDFIKVHSRLPRNIFFALAQHCRATSISFTAHLPKDITAIEASDVGVRSIEHTESLLGAVIYEEDEKIRQKNTEDMLKKLYGAYGSNIALHMARNANFYDPTLISLYRVHGTTYEKWLGPKLLPLITLLYKAGVPLLTGSDFASSEAGIRPGYDLPDELVLFTKAGMKPFEALQAATINPAKCLFIQDFVGSVEKGKKADLVLLDQNPLLDIRNIKKIHAVILNGRYLSRKYLNQITQKYYPIRHR
jgi:imidazolonepropionase-like amidohydrolase